MLCSASRACWCIPSWIIEVKQKTFFRMRMPFSFCGVFQLKLKFLFSMEPYNRFFAFFFDEILSQDVRFLVIICLPFMTSKLRCVTCRTDFYDVHFYINLFSMKSTFKGTISCLKWWFRPTAIIAARYSQLARPTNNAAIRQSRLSNSLAPL